MEEKILIKSEFDKKARNILLSVMGTFFVACSMIFLILIMIDIEESYSIYNRYLDYTYESTMTYSGLEAAFNGYVGCLVFFILACLFFVLGVITLIMFLVHKKCELTVTEKSVKGKTLLGKEVVLPMYMISSYSTRKFLSTIAVATASGITKFSFVKNYKDIGNILSQNINERQDKTTYTESNMTTANTTPSNSALEDIVKLKSMLDMGIITQEEFEAKKKQLLDL